MNLIVEDKPVTYVIHRGSKNDKIKGYLKIVVDLEQGKQFLVGEQITGTYQVRGEEMETKKKIRIDITGLAVSRSK